jgi:Kef-type K+ transport system membrane component KefB
MNLVLLLAQIAVITLVSRVVGMIAKRVGQPQVVAEIAGGIALGPSLLGKYWPEAQQALFPAASLGGLKLLAQFGLLLFMFLIGLELDPKLLNGRKKASVAISQTSIVLPFGLGVALAMSLHGSLAPAGVSFLPFALFMGIAMSITAFPVLARILKERNLMRSRVGAIAIACAAVDDVSAWTLLAFVVAITASKGMSGALWTLALSVAYVATILLVVRPLLARLLKGRESEPDRGKSEGKRAELYTSVAAIALFVASSWTTEQIGIHALFGAFLAGVALPRGVKLSPKLLRGITFVATVLLLPTFFAYSGLRTRVGLVQSAADWGLVALIIGLATVGKGLGSSLAARACGMRWREASAIGVLMNTRGLVELIVLNIGLDLGVISPMLFTMLVLMALVTTLATTPLVNWVYPEREVLREAELDTIPPLSGPAASEPAGSAAH